MKKSIIASLVLVFSLIISSTTLASYWNDPGWQDNPYFTHQTWDFNSDQKTNITPDEYVNTTGTPATINLVGDNYIWSSEKLGREGVWTVYTEPSVLDIYVPNTRNDDMVKEVWLQVTYFNPVPDVQDPFSFFWTVPGSQYDVTMTSESIDDAGDGWAYYTATFQIDPQPQWEELLLTFNVPTNRYMKFDEIDIDTRCVVPEPMTIAFLLLGVFFLIKIKHRTVA